MIDKETLKKLNKLVLSLNEASDIESATRSFLRQLKFIIPFDLAVTGINTQPKGQYKSAPPILVGSVSPAFENEFVEALLKYTKYDYMNWLFYTKQSLVYRDTDLVNEELRKNNLYYQKVMEAYDLIYACGILVVNNERITSSIALYKGSHGGDFTDDDLFVLEYLSPHLERTYGQYMERLNNDYSLTTALHNEYRLTEREMEIIKYIIEGHTNNEIASKTFVQTNTVKKHIYNIYIKLGVSSRTQLLSFILKKGYLDYFIELETGDEQTD